MGRSPSEGSEGTEKAAFYCMRLLCLPLLLACGGVEDASHKAVGCCAARRSPVKSCSPTVVVIPSIEFQYTDGWLVSQEKMLPSFVIPNRRVNSYGAEGDKK